MRWFEQVKLQKMVGGAAWTCLLFKVELLKQEKNSHLCLPLSPHI